MVPGCNFYEKDRLYDYNVGRRGEPIHHARKYTVPETVERMNQTMDTKMLSR